MDVPTIKLTAIQVLGLAAFGVVLGRQILRLIPALDRLSVPAAILGGLVYSVANLLMRNRVANIEFDVVLRDILMIAFFTTIGMGASLRLLRIGGRHVAIFLTAAVAGLIAQIAWGSGMAAMLGLPPLLGVIPGAVSLTGGPATALAFGPEFEKAGVAGATTIGLASAVFGIVVSGLLGGYVGEHLVRKHGLRPAAGSGEDATAAVHAYSQAPERAGGYFEHVIAIAIAMALGSLLSAEFQSRGITLPAYIGAMIVAGALRNLDDAFPLIGIAPQRMEEVGNIALELFIVMALLTLQLWHLAALAVPVLIILAGQVAITVVLCWTLIFRMMGRDYTAAVTSGGYCGFMLGTTANAMACMGEIMQKHGHTPQAPFVVSIVGAFLIDFLNALLINGALNLLR